MKEVIFNRRNELLRVPLAKAMFYEALKKVKELYEHQQIWKSEKKSS
ncbi:MAG: hypothetical protein IKH26_01810 [Bacteroidaceae bacterium]|nr:hypothetical protein [Bacteroidaceae bacterium]